MTNQEIAQHLYDVAFCYKQDNKAFQAKAFENIAIQVQNLTHPLEFDESDRLTTKLHKCGPATTKVIEQFRTTGISKKYAKFLEEGKAPATVNELTRIPGVGVKTAVKIYQTFKIQTMEELGNKIELLKHTDFEKYIEPFLSVKDKSERLPRSLVKAVMDQILSGLTVEWIYAGSMRRKRETVRDVDIIVVENERLDKALLRNYFLEQFGLEPNVRDGEDKLGIDVPVADQFVTLDLNFCKPEEYGGYINYLTGDKNFNVECRKRCKARGWLLNQKGVFDSEGKQLDDSTEEGLFRLLEIPYVPPECRTGADAVGKDFSDLVTNETVITDLHCHSTDSDGGAPWDVMIQSAASQGIRVLGITDHSTGSGNGLKPEEKLQKIQAFKDSQGKFPIKVLYGAEVDIKVDGSLDYDENVIDQLQYVIFALHHGYTKNVEERLIGALERFRHVPKMIAHPGGRRIELHNPRPPAEADWDKIFKVCRETNTLLEINGQPSRRDAHPELIRKGLDAGVYFATNSDCHGVNFRRLLNIAVETGRRGWLMKDRCVSSNLDLLDKWLANSLYS